MSSPRFAALRIRDYRRYFLLGLLSQTADNIEHVISYWVIFQKFHSPTLAGFAVISHWVPFLLFSFYMGALADRYDCRKLIQISQGMFMLASLAWGLLFLTDTLQLWHAVAILLVHGAAGVFAATATPAHPARHGRQHGSAERDPDQRQQPESRHPAGPGGRRRHDAAPRPGRGACSPTSALYWPFTLFLARVPYTGHGRRGPGAAARRRLRTGAIPSGSCARSAPSGGS